MKYKNEFTIPREDGPPLCVIEWLTDPNNVPCEVGRLEAFSDELAGRHVLRRAMPWLGRDETERNSHTVRSVFQSRCCGDREPPTSEELYDAMRRETWTRRDELVLRTWSIEPSEGEWLRAWMERAYSWRMLARAVKEAGYKIPRRVRWLNSWANRPELIPDEWKWID